MLRDLAPYFCVFEDCATPCVRFSSSKLLEQHLASSHSDSFWVCPACPSADTSSYRFTDASKFVTHLSTHHQEYAGPTNLTFMIEHTARVEPHMFQECVFCNGRVESETHDAIEYWNKLVRHMLHDHMRSMAMLSLPWLPLVPDVASDTRESATVCSRERIDCEPEAPGQSKAAYDALDQTETGLQPSGSNSALLIESLLKIDEHESPRDVTGWLTRGTSSTGQAGIDNTHRSEEGSTMEPFDGRSIRWSSDDSSAENLDSARNDDVSLEETSTQTLDITLHQPKPEDRSRDDTVSVFMTEQSRPKVTEKVVQGSSDERGPVARFTSNVIEKGVQILPGTMVR